MVCEQACGRDQAPHDSSSHFSRKTIRLALAEAPACDESVALGELISMKHREAMKEHGNNPYAAAGFELFVLRVRLVLVLDVRFG